MTLKINSGDVLGKGGYGFVCKGELASEVQIIYMYMVISLVCMSL